MNNDSGRKPKKKKHNLCAQYLFSADVVFHQCQSNHGTVFWHQSLLKEKKVKEKWTERGKIWGCGGENDKEGKNESG